MATTREPVALPSTSAPRTSRSFSPFSSCSLLVDTTVPTTRPSSMALASPRAHEEEERAHAQQAVRDHVLEVVVVAPRHVTRREEPDQGACDEQDHPDERARI